jgi:hypothetical protein
MTYDVASRGNTLVASVRRQGTSLAPRIAQLRKTTDPSFRKHDTLGPASAGPFFLEPTMFNRQIIGRPRPPCPKKIALTAIVDQADNST